MPGNTPARKPSLADAIHRIISREDAPAEDPNSLTLTLSHGAQQRPIAHMDDITYPAFTSSGPHTDAFQEETATGLVSAEEVEDPNNRAPPRSPSSPSHARRLSLSLRRSISRKSPPLMNDSSPLGRAISHGTIHRRLTAEEDIGYPSVTSSGPHTDAYLEETPTGLVDAEEAEGGAVTRSTTRTRVGSDPEKGGKDAKLVTWLDGDPENPRNWTFTQKWYAPFGAAA